LFSYGGYATKSRQEMITSGIAANKKQKKSYLNDSSIKCLANHDIGIKSQVG
jgi:hypothetical protein